jgi:hypothetical protein
MLLLSLAAAASLFTAEPAAPRTPLLAMAAVPCTGTPTRHVSEMYLENARRFVTTGDLEAARREYRIARMLEADGGCLPEATSNELATVLLAESRAKEAAIVMRELAADAARENDIDMEARARVAAAWLVVQAGDRTAAKTDVRRLHEIARDPRISAETRTLLRASLRR